MSRPAQLLQQMLKILWRRAFDGDLLARAWMNKLKMHGMQRHAVNHLLLGFLAMVFSIADQRVPQGRKLRSDLVLQSRHQFHANKRGVGKDAFNLISEFGARGFRIFGRSQLLEHSLTPEIMHQRA